MENTESESVENWKWTTAKQPKACGSLAGTFPTSWQAHWAERLWKYLQVPSLFLRGSDYGPHLLVAFLSTRGALFKLRNLTIDWDDRRENKPPKFGDLVQRINTRELFNGKIRAFIG